MDKAKIIQVLDSLPEEWFNIAYVVTIYKEVIKIQMEYNSNLVKELINANRWEHRIENDNGFMEFKRDDGLEITMT